MRNEITRNEITITCPCCSVRLVVDVATAQVRSDRSIRKDKDRGKAQPEDPTADPFGDALKNMKEAEKTADSRFKKAVSSEGERGKKLEEFFEQAKQDAKDDDTPPPSPFEFD
jgi:hypothetical protein